MSVNLEIKETSVFLAIELCGYYAALSNNFCGQFSDRSLKFFAGFPQNLFFENLALMQKPNLAFTTLPSLPFNKMFFFVLTIFMGEPFFQCFGSA